MNAYPPGAYDPDLERFSCCGGRVCVCDPDEPVGPPVDCVNGDCTRTDEHEVRDECEPYCKPPYKHHGTTWHGYWCDGCKEIDWDAFNDERKDR